MREIQKVSPHISTNSVVICISSHFLASSCSSAVIFNVFQGQIKVDLGQVRKQCSESESLTSCVFSYVTEIPAQTLVLAIPQIWQSRRIVFQISSVHRQSKSLNTKPRIQSRLETTDCTQGKKDVTGIWATLFTAGLSRIYQIMSKGLLNSLGLSPQNLVNKSLRISGRVFS